MKVLILFAAFACVAAKPSPIFEHYFGKLIPDAYPTTYTVPVVKPDGFLADTPEVAAAKSLHFAQWEAAKSRTFSPIVPIVPPVAPLSPIDYRYISPIVHTPIVPLVHKEGFLADTPEVAAEKTRHFIEVAKAKARVGYPYLL